MPQPAVLARPGTGNVIPLADRRCPQRAAERAARADPKSELAYTVQAMLLARGQSLTDPATAETFDATMGAVLLMVDGARAQALMDDSGWHALRAMFEEMRQAPTLV
ncbi:hypothetical protein GCM10019017_10930 [Streptomyces showdoensis]